MIFTLILWNRHRNFSALLFGNKTETILQASVMRLGRPPSVDLWLCCIFIISAHSVLCQNEKTNYNSDERILDRNVRDVFNSFTDVVSSFFTSSKKAPASGNKSSHSNVQRRPTNTFMDGEQKSSRLRDSLFLYPQGMFFILILQLLLYHFQFYYCICYSLLLFHL